MKAFVVATPLFDAAMSVSAYRLCDRSAAESLLSIKNDYRGMREALASPGLDLVSKLGIEPFAGDKPLFADINRLQLLAGLPTRVPVEPGRLVCVLPADIPPDGDILNKCTEMTGAGYRFALEGFPRPGAGGYLLPYADYVVLDYKKLDFHQHLHAMQTDMPGKRVVVVNVPDTKSYQDLAARAPGALYTGDFYSRPVTAGAGAISPLKINALQLLRQVNEPDFDLRDIARIISRDPALTIALMRFINSRAVGLSRKVESIQSAVAILGQEEVRRWATIAISAQLAEDRPGEITKLSMVRAKFAENLALPFEMGINQSSLFMAGLFSLLDAILQKPMAEAIAEVAVNDLIRKALVDRQGELYTVLELIYAYERADWDRVSILMVQHNTDVEAVSGAFVDALVWYHNLLQAIEEDQAEADEAPAAEAAPPPPAEPAR